MGHRVAGGQELTTYCVISHKLSICPASVLSSSAPVLVLSGLVRSSCVLLGCQIS